MRIGLIDVEYTSVRLTTPKVDVMALITVRRRLDRQYTITGARDSLTAERVDITEAQRRNILDTGMSSKYFIQIFIYNLLIHFDWSSI